MMKQSAKQTKPPQTRTEQSAGGVVFRRRNNGIEIGMVELDFRREGACEIGYFALVPELAGQGHGRWLMAQALAIGWRPGVAKVWLHTCTLDHPSALGFYRAQGFVAVKRTIETFPDPRASGLLQPETAPQIPYLAKRG